MKIKSGDEVMVLVGKDKGNKGKVDKVLPKLNTAIVVGINIYKRHKKAQKGTIQGGVIDITKPIAISNLSIVCPKCKLPTKIGYKLEKNSKKRVCKKCKQVID